MPGVPPNAMAQMKKGLKGLFSRKKKNTKASASQDTSAMSNPTAETKNEGKAPMAVNEPSSSGTPHIAEPGNVSSSQAIDLNPAVPALGKEEGKLGSKAANDGMSATSGPVSTDLYGSEGASAAPAAASKEKDNDDASEEAIEDMEEGHGKMEGAAAVESKSEVVAGKTA